MPQQKVSTFNIFNKSCFVHWYHAYENSFMWDKEEPRSYSSYVKFPTGVSECVSSSPGATLNPYFLLTHTSWWHAHAHTLTYTHSGREGKRMSQGNTQRIASAGLLPTCQKSQDCVRLKPRVRNSIWVTCLGDGDPTPWTKSSIRVCHMGDRNHTCWDTTQSAS